MFRTQCLGCGSGTLHEVINLGMHPLADSFIPAERLQEPDKVYLLACDFCAECGQVQNRTVTPPEERYALTEYSYTSSHSNTARDYWQNYARHVGAQTGLTAGDVVVEIGSNDGFLGACFAETGCTVLGVDASPAMARLAERRGVETVNAFFNAAALAEINARLPRPPKLMVANNVYNHADEPLDFAKTVRDLLAPDGTFVFEVPYWAVSVRELKFDMIYHEHVNWFTATCARNLMDRAGLKIVHVEESDYHGGSIRFFAWHKARSGNSFAGAESLQGYLEREQKMGLFNPETYQAYARRVRDRRDRFLERIYELKNQGDSIVCIGAAAKGNTFLNYYNLDSSVIDFVTDASPAKIGKATPRTRIPIVPDEALARFDRVHAIITAWNLSGPLRAILLKINPRIQFLNPYHTDYDP